MPLRVLLTGHNGYIGSALAPLLQACGHVVVGLDAGYFRECTLGNAAQDPPCLWKDVRDVDADTLRRFDAVIHLAAVVPRLGHGVTDGAVESINGKSALRLAKLAKRAGAARFIMASSSLEAPETDAWPEPDVNTECGITALADDSFAPLVLRLPEVYGASPRFRADLPFNRMALAAFTGSAIRLPNANQAMRPLIHVDDVATAFATALLTPSALTSGRILDVGWERECHADGDLARIITDALPECSIECISGVGDAANVGPVNFVKFQALLPGCFPQWSAATGLQQMLDAFCRAGITASDLAGYRFDRRMQLESLRARGEVRSDLHWKRGLGEEMATWAA